MDLKKTNAPVNTITYNKSVIEEPTGNVYEAITIMAKRANQINSEIKKELTEKLDEFATYNDSLEEVFENKEQIEVSKFYEKLPKSHALAVQEWLTIKYITETLTNNKMSVLSGKKVVLGISGGIAAYKTASLVRLFIKAGAQVQVIMTPASKDFITPLTLSTLSKNPVHSTFYNEEEDGAQWNNHVDLALWADFMLIAPATANTLSKMVNGNCDNLLIATYLSAKCPVYFAPAMDLDMYKHPSTIASFKALKAFGNTIIPAENGELASGLSGEGRMAEPENIIAFLEADLESKLPLKRKKNTNYCRSHIRSNRSCTFYRKSFFRKNGF
jgi:DNA-directed RNA polymerase subunit K/omega